MILPHNKPTRNKLLTLSGGDNTNSEVSPFYESNTKYGDKNRDFTAIAIEIIDQEIFTPRKHVETLKSNDQSFHGASEKAYIYANSSYKQVGLGRLPALLVTFIVELLPAFVFSTGITELSDRLGREKAGTFIGFIAIVSAIGGNVGLQSSSINTRAISHCLVHNTNWKEAYLKEFLVAILLGIFLLGITGVVAWIWAKSIRVGICVGCAQFFSIVFAGVSGTASPMIFHMLLGRDPGMWAGPLETAVQDIVGALSLFYFSVFMLDSVLPKTWS